MESQVARASRAWMRAAGSALPSGPRYGTQEQQAREQAYDRALSEVEHESSLAARSRCDETQQRLVACFARFSASALALDPPAIDRLTHGFLPAGIALARWAHRFDAALTYAEIAQACRNGWTACGLQPLFGARLEMTPAILAYSLLYPYSDNFLDDQRSTRRDKLRVGGRFHARLQGEPVPPINVREASMWQMVAMIERQYPRPGFPEVFDALLAIHEAQMQSLNQLHCPGSLDAAEILRISCAKGGTSVLADAVLVRGHVTDPESDFAFAWGVLLQLGDDLQDLHEDLLRGSQTLFTAAIMRGEPLDKLVIQLLQFGNWVTSLMLGLTSGEEAFRQLLRMSWRSLILMAVAYVPEFFTPSFLAALERGSPFRFAFLRARRARLRGNSGLFERLFRVFLEAAPERPGIAAMPASPLFLCIEPASPTST